MSTWLNCNDHFGHKWLTGGHPLAVITSTSRHYYCQRCGCLGWGVAVFHDGIRAEFIAKKYQIGKYAN